MKRLLTAILALLALFKLARGEGRHDEEEEQIVEQGPRSPGAELAVLALLVLTALASVLFVVAYALNWSTQALGGILGGALACLAAALIVTALQLVVTEEVPESYPEPESAEEQRKVAAIVRQSGSRLTRKRLLMTAAGMAGSALGIAFLTPVVSLGPVFDTSRLNESPWRRGRRLVDKDGKPIAAGAIEAGAFYTAFPEGVEPKLISAPVVLVRLDPSALRLPRGRKGWAPEGILAYSKICTHAGCAIALYRTPTFPPTQPSNALVCPCHYSTFDVAAGGTVLFGPAGRSLPQLPLMIDSARNLRAAGDYSGPPGPSWWGVRNRERST